MIKNAIPKKSAFSSCLTYQKQYTMFVGTQKFLYLSKGVSCFVSQEQKIARFRIKRGMRREERS